MIRLISALGLLITILFAICALSSCSRTVGLAGWHSGGSQSGSGSKENGSDGGEDNNAGSADEPDEPDDSAGEIQIPESDSFSKNAVKFDEIVFSMPDIPWLYAALAKAESVVNENTMTFDEQMAHITVAQNAYDNFITMYTFAEIMSLHSSGNGELFEEYGILSEYYHSVMKEMEDMLTAAAGSPHAVRFESDYYGSGLINRYRDGGKYTDNTIALFEDEAKLVKQYKELSPTTVYVYFDGITDTFAKTITRLKARYGEGTPEYEIAEMKCTKAYGVRLKETAADILVSLLKVRKRIADQLNYPSYVEYAYATAYHDYPVDYTGVLANNIGDYLVPVYNKSYIRVLKDYIEPTHYGVGRATMINSIADALKTTDSDLYGAYSFMLSYGLFDIGERAGDRNGGATRYLVEYDSPFLIARADGSVIDYASVSHEFGHFYDMFVNWGEGTSSDLSEVSAAALEMLILTRLDDHLSAEDYKFLYHSELNRLMSDIIRFAFSSRFEHLAYKLSYYDITVENLEKCARDAAEELSLDVDRYGNIHSAALPEVYCEPLSSQSYCTSSAVALDIFIKEMRDEGEGFAIYKRLVNRSSAGSFTDFLSRVSLESPFSADMIKRIADFSHYYIFGSHYYDEYKNSTVQHRITGEVYFLPEKPSGKRAA
ncbi:MAG: hypothetical protein IJY69_06545 [Clostridia bacterium]|nr:hypothetical protein [Clostridia bacterium]